MCEREERGHGEGVCVCATLLSDTLYPNGHTETDTRPGVWLCNKPMDLSAFVSEECGHGERESVCDTLLSIHHRQMVAQEQARDLGFGCAINQRT